MCDTSSGLQHHVGIVVSPIEVYNNHYKTHVKSNNIVVQGDYNADIIDTIPSHFIVLDNCIYNKHDIDIARAIFSPTRPPYGYHRRIYANVWIMFNGINV